ncbi:uncharacterized protein [Antedon mediterranea]|uniref:uncharacterized protein n=1 Tax=Antedon mediterranea TaxID=105859 RepID=UPI003AF5948B
MYHRISIPESDQQVHRFLWRDCNQAKRANTYVKTNKQTSFCHGSSSFEKTAKVNKETHPEAAQVITNDSYMDDILTSVFDVNSAEQLSTDIDQVLKTGGFQVKEGISNGQINNSPTNQQLNDKSVLSDELEQKFLGVVWYPTTDLLLYKVEPDSFPENVLTKGIATAFPIRGKNLKQKLWQQGCDWDDDLNENNKAEWRQFFTELADLDNVSFPRCLLSNSSFKPPELIVFCDASENAFGSVAHTRWEDTEHKFEVRFISAKSRVAPLKQLSMPRLELQAAVVASRLYSTIKEEMTVSFDRVVFFSDSIIVLSWIRGQSRLYKSFVANRVAEIQGHTDPSDWRHIPGENNIAMFLDLLRNRRRNTV